MRSDSKTKQGRSYCAVRTSETAGIPSNEDAGATNTLFDAQNHKYGIRYVLFGKEINEKTGQVERAVLQTTQGSALVEYDLTSLKLLAPSDILCASPWSTDEEHFVLPLGRFDGFQVIKSKNLINMVQRPLTNQSMRVAIKDKEGKAGTALYHSFGKWVDGSTFLFAAGLSMDMVHFKYDIRRKQLDVIDAEPGSFVGVDECGMIMAVTKEKKGKGVVLGK